jgi:hypothetical protein
VRSLAKLTRKELLERASTQETKAEREESLGLHRIAAFRRNRAELFRAMAKAKLTG